MLLSRKMRNVMRKWMRILSKVKLIRVVIGRMLNVSDCEK